MINYPLSKEVQEAVSAFEEGCFSNAYYGALYLLDKGYKNVVYVVGEYITPHITTAGYHVWLVVDGEIVDPTTVIAYNQADANRVQYIPAKKYNSEYLKKYDSLLQDRPFIDIEKSPDSYNQEVKMKFYKSYIKTMDSDIRTNPSFSQWIRDTHEALLTLSEMRSDRNSMFPILSAMLADCEVFLEQYTAADKVGIYLVDLGDDLEMLINLCGSSNQSDDTLYENCQMVADQFNDCINVIDDYMDSLGAQTAVTTISSKSQTVKFSIGDVANAILNRIPVIGDRRQAQQLEKETDKELNALFDEFTKMGVWWKNIAEVYGTMAGEIDNFKQDFHDTIAQVAPTLYQELWNTQGGFKEWFINYVDPILNMIRPPKGGAAPFDKVLSAFQELVAETGRLAKIDLQEYLPVQDSPDNWAQVASYQGRKTRGVRSAEFADWAKECNETLKKKILNEPPAEIAKKAPVLLKEMAKQMNEFIDNEPELEDIYGASNIIKTLLFSAEQAAKVNGSNVDVFIESLKAGMEGFTLLHKEETQRLKDANKSFNKTSWKATVNEDFSEWALVCHDELKGFSYYTPEEIRGIAVPTLNSMARTLDDFASEAPDLQESYDLTDIAKTIRKSAASFSKITDRSLPVFKDTLGNLIEGFWKLYQDETKRLSG